ncbi:MAG: hypothetical protein ABEJ05_00910 [Haloglomus sp.]
MSVSSDADPGPPESFRVAAEELVDYWDDYPLDFTPASLRHLDSLVDTYYGPDDAAAESDPEALSGVAAQLGSYFGETLVRSHGGEWQRGRSNWSVALAGPEGEATVNVFGVAAGALAEPAAFSETYETVATELGLA